MARLTLLALTSVLIVAQQSEEKTEPHDKYRVTIEDGFSCIEVKFSFEETKPNKACFGNFLKKEDEVGHNPFGADMTCFKWCSQETCLSLSGNRTQECGACGPAAKCHPAAADWGMFKANPKELRCEAYCEGNACLDLKGNPATECAACKGEYKCQPGSDNFDNYLERKRLSKLEAETRTEL